MRPSSRRGATNRNERGNSRDRAARRAFLLAKFGDGKSAPCMADDHHHACPGMVTDETVSADRIIPKVDGGKYTRDNIQPVYVLCNARQGGLIAQARRKPWA